jgi:hypothetical protein
MKLIDTDTGRALRIGDTVTTFRGERMTLDDMTPPQHPGSTGRVYLSEPDNPQRAQGYFPGVINAKFIRKDTP